MSPKMGRPLAENPKSNPLHVRLDSNDLRTLDKYCEENHLKRTEGIRDGIKLLETRCKKE